MIKQSQDSTSLSKLTDWFSGLDSAKRLALLSVLGAAGGGGLAAARAASITPPGDESRKRKTLYSGLRGAIAGGMGLPAIDLAAGLLRGKIKLPAEASEDTPMLDRVKEEYERIRSHKEQAKKLEAGGKASPPDPGAMRIGKPSGSTLAAGVAGAVGVPHTRLSVYNQGYEQGHANVQSALKDWRSSKKWYQGRGIIPAKEWKRLEEAYVPSPKNMEGIPASERVLFNKQRIAFNKQRPRAKNLRALLGGALAIYLKDVILSRL